MGAPRAVNGLCRSIFGTSSLQIASQVGMSINNSAPQTAFLMKPHQGKLFRPFRKLILNLSNTDVDLAHKSEDHGCVLEEQPENGDVRLL
jgi:hypothetical protein